MPRTRHRQLAGPSSASAIVHPMSIDGRERSGRQPDAPGTRLGLAIARGRAAISATGNERGIFERTGRVSDQFGLGLDDSRRTTIAVRKQATELVDDIVRVEADGLGVVADECPRKDA